MQGSLPWIVGTAQKEPGACALSGCALSLLCLIEAVLCREGACALSSCALFQSLDQGGYAWGVAAVVPMLAALPMRSGTCALSCGSRVVGRVVVTDMYWHYQPEGWVLESTWGTLAANATMPMREGQGVIVVSETVY